ncbi:MAG: hypothetical protein ACYC6L_11985 [Anaerolineae bacterium]
MDKQKGLEVLKHGMSTEIWGLNFYQQALEHTTDASGKAVFKSLIVEEESHLRILQGQYAALMGQKPGWLSRSKALKLAESVDPTTIFPAGQNAGQYIEATATDLDVLVMAMDFERKGFEFYTKEAALATDAEAKQMWDYLAKAENKHYTFIQKTHEYLSTNGVWFFDENEKPFFEG